MLKGAAILKRNFRGALEAAWTRIIGIDVIAHLPRQCEDFRITEILIVIGVLAKLPAVERLRQRVLQAYAAVRIGSGREFFRNGLADDGDDESGDGAVDALDLIRRDGMLAAQTQHGVDIRMDDVRRGKWLER